MMRMFKTLREENEVVVKLKGLAPDSKIPKGVLAMGREALEKELGMFSNVKEMDAVNEKRPDMRSDLSTVSETKSKP